MVRMYGKQCLHSECIVLCVCTQVQRWKGNPLVKGHGAIVLRSDDGKAFPQSIVYQRWSAQQCLPLSRKY